jgi:hypothetical protein
VKDRSMLTNPDFADALKDAGGRWRTLATPGESFSWFSWFVVIMVGDPAMFNFNLH